MSKDKFFKTIEQQIEILSNRGLSIPDKDIAKQFLLQNNYYRISGYSLTLRKNDVFYKNVTFQNIIDIYNFDHELRHMLLKYIEIVEVKFKSIFVYYFTKQYGPTGYLDNELFSDDVIYNIIINKAEFQKVKRLPHEPYLKHFVEDLNQDIPLWAYIDLLTISDVSILYSISSEQIKKEVAEEFDLNMKRGSELLGKFMHSMTIIRNLCAHGSRLYNRLFEQKPSLNSREQKFLRKNADGTIDNSRLYGFIFIIKKLLQNDDFNSLKCELENLTEKYPFVNLRYYGFNENWKNVL